jgi:hypothetical protein
MERDGTAFHMYTVGGHGRVNSLLFKCVTCIQQYSSHAHSKVITHVSITMATVTLLSHKDQQPLKANDHHAMANLITRIFVNIISEGPKSLNSSQQAQTTKHCLSHSVCLSVRWRRLHNTLCTYHTATWRWFSCIYQFHTKLYETWNTYICKYRYKLPFNGQTPTARNADGLYQQQCTSSALPFQEVTPPRKKLLLCNNFVLCTPQRSK